MDKGDLVRCRTLDAKQYKFGFIEDPAFEEVWDEVGVVIEYNSWEKMATVLVQSTGKKIRIAARDLELIKRDPKNKERLMNVSKLKKFPLQIYCDMDGVLVDFEGPATERIREALKAPPEGLESLCKDVLSVFGPDIDITQIKKTKTPRTESLRTLIGKLFEEDVDWWASLPFLEEGQKLWAVISKLDKPVTILTSPMDQNGFSASAEGKILWVKKNLCSLDTIRWDERIVFSHNKYEYALDGDNPAVLIDDFPKKVDPFNSNGGIGILHKGDSKETLKNLENVYEDLGYNLGED